MDRVRKEDVRRRTGVTRELAGRSEQSVLRWFGHVWRMEEDRLVKRIIGPDARGVRFFSESLISIGGDWK